MANKVNSLGSLPLPNSLFDFTSISDFLVNLIASLNGAFSEIAIRANISYASDGTEVLTAPLRLKPYVKASLPSASTFIDGMIIVTDDVGGRTPAFSDGTNWRRTADRNIIS